ncbi:hypothetical protein CYJ37_08760 [Bacillus sp. UMB0728]|nr:hypothetical protein CYJ37_08760 [Bacillus sp. UMB0728]
MSMEMKPEIKMALENISFEDRYRSLSARYKANSNDMEDRLESYEKDKVEEIFNSLGYPAKFDKREKFFKLGVEYKSPDYKIWFNISVELGMTEFIWVVYHENEVQLGSPWSIYSRFLNPSGQRIKKPVYRSYEELEEILKEAILMYEDFKRELIKIYSPE